MFYHQKVARVRVFADIQNFALRAHCVCTACMAFPRYPVPGVYAGGPNGGCPRNTAQFFGAPHPEGSPGLRLRGMGTAGSSK